MDSIQISIEATEEQQEILISQLDELNANGFEQTETHLLAFFSENNFDSYEINKLLKPYTFNLTTIEEQNWNKVWESNFSPVVVSGFCSIRADFHDPVKGVEHEIIITPKMSFGTGHHATTHMMVEQMNEIDFRNRSVFDFGTGTGILAILAEKLGAGKVIATDIDKWSIENAKENMEKNNCEKVSVIMTEKIPDQKFDIILANINRNVILDYLPGLKSSLMPGGRLLLSGILKPDESDIVEACRLLLLNNLKKLERNNWISLLFVN